MGNVKNPVTTEKALMGGNTSKIIQFGKRKPKDIQPYINCDKGWKFTEDDKEFLMNYYEDCIKVQNEEFDGDFVEDPTEILSSLKENGVEASKDLIQMDARIMAEAVCDDIYHYYADSPDILKLIENSILDVKW